MPETNRNSVDLAKLDRIVDDYRAQRGSLIGLLQDASEEYGYLPVEVLEELSERLRISLSHFYSLATFYASFRLEPMGEHYCSICVGTACHVRGATGVAEAIERELGIEAGQTTEDGKFTVEKVNCLGACAMGPLVVIDDKYHGKLDARKAVRLIKKYED